MKPYQIGGAMITHLKEIGKSRDYGDKVMVTETGKIIWGLDEPKPTMVQLQVLHDADNMKKMKKSSLMEGIDFQGVVCSATESDLSRLLPVYIQFKEGLRTKPFPFTFSNGNTLMITVSNYLDVTQQLVAFSEGVE